MTKKTKAPVREGVKKAKAPVREGLAFLIEDALQRSEVVIAAEAIVEKLQSMAEDLSKVEANDIMPLFDSLTNAFGPQVAQNFNTVATEQVRNLITGVQQAKAAMDGEILRLKKAVEGGDTSDMGMSDEMPLAPGGEPGMAPPAGPDAGLSDVPPEGMPPDEGMPPETGEDALAIGGDFAGRPKKMESRRTKGKIAEDNMMPHSHESTNFPTNLANLAVFHPGAGRLAQAIANQIRTKELSLEQRKGLSSVLSNISAFGHESAHWSGIDPNAAVNMKLRAEHITENETPVVEMIVGELRKLAFMLNLHHDHMLESNIAMLRKASDPDALILKTFRTKLAEARDGQWAAIRTARTFAIDIEDVVAVVKEAAARRPFKEDAPPLMQGASLFPVNTGAATGTGAPNPVPNTMPDPNAQPLGMANNQSASTVKPLSPADLRAQQNMQQQQTAISQATTPNPNAQPNNQVVQSTTRDVHPQQPQNTQTLPSGHSGQSNPAMRRGFMQK